MKIRKAQKQVAEFMVAGGQLEERPKKAQIPDREVFQRRVNMLQEELQELIDARAAGDIVGVADAWGDLCYVLLGGVEECGMDLEPILTTIMYANGYKIDWEAEPPRPFAVREDGKILKPEGWIGPEEVIAEILADGR